MHSMEIDRRRFLALLAAYGAGPLATTVAFARDGSLLPPTAATPAAADTVQARDVISATDQAPHNAGPSDTLYVAARKNTGRFEAAVIDEQGNDRLVIPMPDRGHSFAIDPLLGRAVVFGRQPGFFALAFDVAGKSAPQALQAAAGRHFFGHGVYSPDGNIMVATENDYEAGRGVLGIYDAAEGAGYRRVGEYSSAGIGPHEVVLMPDGHTLCVANGGILTHPDYGKLQLNADSMQPSLAYIDLHTGVLQEQIFLSPELSKLSIRHLVIDAAGAVWFGCQYTGTAEDRPSLVGRHHRGSSPQLFSGPVETLRSMENYVGSLAVNKAGTVIAASSPVGSKIIFWDAASGECAGSVDMFDGCGVAAAESQGFIVSSGQGAIAHILAGEEKKAIQKPVAGLAWDNHLRRING